MATLTARPTPAGPMSESIRPATTSSEEANNDWEVEYRAELQERQKERLAELHKQAEDDFNKKKAQNPEDRVYLERIHESYRRNLARIKQMMRDEEDAMVDRERQVRQWSMGEVVVDEASEQLKREQQALWDQLRGKQYSDETSSEQQSRRPEPPNSSSDTQRSTTHPPRQPSQTTAQQPRPNARPAMWTPPESQKESDHLSAPRQTQRSVSGSSTAHSFVQSPRSDTSAHSPYGPQLSPSVALGHGLPSKHPSPWIPEGSYVSRPVYAEPDDYYEDDDDDSRSDSSDSREDEVETDAEEVSGHPQIPTAPPAPPVPAQKSAPWNIQSNSRRPSVASFGSTSGSPGQQHSIWRPSHDNLNAKFQQPLSSRPVGNPIHVVDYADVKQQSPGFPPGAGGTPRVQIQQQRVPSVPPAASSLSAMEREAAALREVEKPWTSHEQARMKTSSAPSPPLSHTSPPFRQEMRARPASTDTEYTPSHLPHSDGRPYMFQSSQPPIPSSSPVSVPSARKETLDSAASSMRETPQFWMPGSTGSGGGPSNKSSSQSPSLYNINNNTHVPSSRSPAQPPPPSSSANVAQSPSTSTSPPVRVRNDSETSSWRAPSFPGGTPLDIPRPRSPHARSAPPPDSLTQENVAAAAGRYGSSTSSSFTERDRVYPGYASSSTSKRSQSPARSARSMFTHSIPEPLSRQATVEIDPEPSRSEHFAPRVRDHVEDAAAASNSSFDSEENWDAFSIFDEASTWGGTHSSASSDHNKEVEEQQRKKEEELKKQEEELQREKEALKEKNEEIKRQMLELLRREEALKAKEEADRKKEEERLRLEREKREREEKEEKEAQEKKRQEEIRKRDEAEARRLAEEEARKLQEQDAAFRYFNAKKQAEDARKKTSTASSASASASASAGVKPPGHGSSASSSYSSASGAGYSRAGSTTSSSSSASSNWSGSQWSSSSSSASSAASGASSSSRSTPQASSTRSTPTPGGATRPPGKESNTPKSGWKTGRVGGGASPSPSSASNASSSASSNVPLSESERRRRQEEHARKQQEQFQREQMQKEQEFQSKHSASSLSGDQIALAWAKYESAWTAMKDKEEGSLSFYEVPWPVFKPRPKAEDLTLTAIRNFVIPNSRNSAKGPVGALRDQLLRWHPDRFETRCLRKVRESDRAAVKEGMDQVVRSLNELLTRENNPLL